MKKASLLLISTLILSVAPTALASAAQSLTISPSSQQLVVEQGTTTQGVMQVVNQGTSDFTFKVYSSAYSVSGEDYHQDFQPIPGKINPADWFKVSTTNYSIKAGETVEVPYSVTVPNGTLSGGYYAVLFAQTTNIAPVNGVSVTDRLGEVFYLTVPGNLVVKGKTVSLTHNWFQAPPLTTSTRIENSGNVHFLTSVSATVTDLFGNTKMDFFTQKEVLPQTIRNIKANWPQAPFFGVYKLHMSVNYLNHTQVVNSWVLVMAVWFRVIVILLAIAAVVFIIGSKRHKKRKAPKTTPKNAKKTTESN